MKKLFFIALLGLITMFSQAQTIGQIKAFVNDTTTDVETEYLIIATPVAINGNYALGVLINGVNVSGTATVTAAIQVSNDNTTFYNYGSSITLNNAGTVSPYAWSLPDTPFKYYRVKLISSGTGVTNLTGHIILKRKQ